MCQKVTIIQVKETVFASSNCESEGLLLYRGRRQYFQVVTVCQKVTIIQGKETVFASGNCESEGYYYTGEGDSICNK